MVGPDPAQLSVHLGRGRLSSRLIRHRPPSSACLALPLVTRALATTKVIPGEVTTDKAAVYPHVLDELTPGAWHRTELYANNRMEADHGQLKQRLRPMRGLKTDQLARIIIAGHAFIQNIRRGH
jgi:transposase-like protein